MEHFQTIFWIVLLIAGCVAVCLAAILLKRGIVWIARRLSGAAVRDLRARDAENQRYRNPDWQFLQQHLQRPVNPALALLYSTYDIGSWPMIQLKDREARLCAIDAESISSGSAEFIGHEIVPLAFDDCGQAIYLKPGNDASDAVYVYDGGEEEILFPSVAEFVETLRSNTANLSLKSRPPAAA